MQATINPAPKYFRKLLLRAGILSIMLICIAEIVFVCLYYIHEPLAWPFLMQATAMFIGTLIGLILGIRRSII
jgi:uncharacterized protein (DUF486 family)